MPYRHQISMDVTFIPNYFMSDVFELYEENLLT
jgi:hypothetical protein